MSDVAIEADATNKAIAIDKVHKADKAITAIESPLDGNEANANDKVNLVSEANEVNKIVVANEFIVIVVFNEANIINEIVAANANNKIINEIVAAGEAIWFCRCCCCWYQRKS